MVWYSYLLPDFESSCLIKVNLIFCRFSLQSHPLLKGRTFNKTFKYESKSIFPSCPFFVVGKSNFIKTNNRIKRNFGNSFHYWGLCGPIGTCRYTKTKRRTKSTTTTKTRRTKQKSSKQKSSHYRFFQDRKYLFKKWSIVSLKMYKSISNFFFRKLLKELSSVKSTFCHTFSEMLWRE